MNTKKFWTAVIAVFVILEITNYLVHGVILSSVYASEEVKQIFRPMEEMVSKMWVRWVADFVWSFFFVFIFVKGYQNKGIMEGVRFGVYIGLFFYFVYSYGSYVMYPLPYYLIFEWFVIGLMQSVLLGIVAALIYKPKESVA